jgi:hypothetical protein
LISSIVAVLLFNVLLNNSSCCKNNLWPLKTSNLFFTAKLDGQYPLVTLEYCCVTQFGRVQTVESTASIKGIAIIVAGIISFTALLVAERTFCLVGIFLKKITCN